VPFKIDESIFDKLAEILKKHELKEIEYQQGDIKIRILGKRDREYQHPVYVPKMDLPVNHEDQKVIVKSQEDNPVNFGEHQGAMKSPMVGTCYLAPEPGAQNFISVGDTVQEGQSILIIEAMKVMNLMKAQRSGQVIHIAVKSGDPVEYGQLLLVIE
jgi:acetyl-CoA carboxylase biotin carboxyl carrier protein